MTFCNGPLLPNVTWFMYMIAKFDNGTEAYSGIQGPFMSGILFITQALGLYSQRFLKKMFYLSIKDKQKAPIVLEQTNL